MNLRDVRTVLVPTDLSDPSLEALATARDLVDGDGSRLSVVHVLPELHPLDPAVSPDLTEGLRVERAEKVVREHLTRAGHADVRVHVSVGDPGRVVPALADSLGVDLVVIASHGYSGVKHLLLGSVAERVVRRAPCPVLVVRRPPGPSAP